MTISYQVQRLTEGEMKHCWVTCNKRVFHASPAPAIFSESIKLYMQYGNANPTQGGAMQREMLRCNMAASEMEGCMHWKIVIV